MSAQPTAQHVCEADCAASPAETTWYTLGDVDVSISALRLYNAGQSPRPIELHHWYQRLLKAPPPPN